jgi:two-component system response regulator DesR
MHMVRGALVALLKLEPDIEVVAELASGDEILLAAHRHLPDVAVIDIDLPGVDGLTAARGIYEQLPQVRTLILTSLGRPGTLRKALSARVGGFILKDAPAGQLAEAIRGVAAGRRVVDSQLAMAAWDSAERPSTARVGVRGGVQSRVRVNGLCR